MPDPTGILYNDLVVRHTPANGVIANINNNQNQTLENSRSNNMMWKEKLAIYDQLVTKCPRFVRKGKTVPYTSANGHMFSLLNKVG